MSKQRSGRATAVFISPRDRRLVHSRPMFNQAAALTITFSLGAPEIISVLLKHVFFLPFLFSLLPLVADSVAATCSYLEYTPSFPPQELLKILPRKSNASAHVPRNSPGGGGGYKMTENDNLVTKWDFI